MKKHALLIFCLVVALAGFSFGTFGLYRQAPGTEDTAAWVMMVKFYSWSSPWFWLLFLAFSAGGLYYLFKLDAPETLQGTTARALLFAGFLFYCLACFIVEFRQVSGLFTVAGAFFVVRQQAALCALKRAAQGPRPPATVSQAVLTKLTGSSS